MMANKEEFCLNQNFIKELLFEYYQKGNNQAGDYMMAQIVVQEMIEKLRAFFSQYKNPINS